MELSETELKSKLQPYENHNNGCEFVTRYFVWFLKLMQNMRE